MGETTQCGGKTLWSTVETDKEEQSALHTVLGFVCVVSGFAGSVVLRVFDSA